MSNVITPTYEGLLIGVHRSLMTEVHTALLAVVVDYDASVQSCSAQPIARQARFLEDGSRSPTRLPLLVDVPVAGPRGGGARLTMPVAAGDLVVILVAQHSIEKIMAYGGTDVDPLQDHRFHPEDSIAIAGLATFAAPLANAPTDRVSLGYDAGASVEVHQDEVRLGDDSASAKVLIGDDGQDLIAALYAAQAALSPSPAAAVIAAIITALGWDPLGLGPGYAHPGMALLHPTAQYPVGASKVKAT